MTSRIRCAIYTRKSTDDGLEQEFNSLDAQRESCEAYIKSQRSLGWVASSAQYDDGGLSGGTMERPALRRLLTDIERRKVDLVVVYKVDRLTRSLADFAKIVDVFDSHEVSFVSVTQQFNTTTSMGRLTLNMLLSFAQFEREVTGERIRDKIAASKKKGMWMGGLPPLGYDVQDKKLVVNAGEAATVRKLFRLYLDFGNVRALMREAERQGIATKRRQSGDRTTGGKPFSRGNLYQLLHNPLYVGEIAHKGATYPGQHEAIIDRQTWDAVQRQLSTNATARQSDENVEGNGLLTGLVFDETGDPLTPTYAVKKGRRYRYYISKRLVHASDQHDDGWRIPAKELEHVVCQTISEYLNDEARIHASLSTPDTSPRLFRRIVQGAAQLSEKLATNGAIELHSLLRQLVQRATLSRSDIRIEISEQQLLRLVLDQSNHGSDQAERIVLIEAPISLRRRGIEAKLIIATSDTRSPDQKLIKLIARSHSWLQQLSSGAAASVREIARQGNHNEDDVSRLLPLAFLAPDIVEAIIAGRQPTELTSESLRRACPIPYSWDEQRMLFGFSN